MNDTPKALVTPCSSCDGNRSKSKSCKYCKGQRKVVTYYTRKYIGHKNRYAIWDPEGSEPYRSQSKKGYKVEFLNDNYPGQKKVVAESCSLHALHSGSNCGWCNGTKKVLVKKKCVFNRGTWEYSWEKYGYTEPAPKEGCFITTAAIKHLNFDESEIILNKFRKFRDSYVKNNHQIKLLEYYIFSPCIVDKINASGKKDSIYYFIWHEYILKAYEKIEDKKHESAYNIYCQCISYLKNI